MILEKKVGSVTINFCSQHPLGVIAHTIFFPLPGALVLVLQFLPPFSLVLPAAGCCCPSCCLMGVESWGGNFAWLCWGSSGVQESPFSTVSHCLIAFSIVHWGQRFLVRELTESFGVVGRENEFIFFSLLQVNLVVLFNRVNFIKSVCYHYHFLCSKNILQYP